MTMQFFPGGEDAGMTTTLFLPHVSSALFFLHDTVGFAGGASGKEPSCQCRRHKRRGFHPWVRKIPQRRKWQPTLVFLPGESHGQEDKGAWWATVHRVTKSQTQRK